MSERAKKGNWIEAEAKKDGETKREAPNIADIKLLHQSRPIES